MHKTCHLRSLLISRSLISKFVHIKWDNSYVGYLNLVSIKILEIVLIILGLFKTIYCNDLNILEVLILVLFARK